MVELKQPSSYERLKPFEQKVVSDNANRLIYTIINSDLFDDISDLQSLLGKYKDFIDNKINNLPFPQITRSEPRRPTIHFLENEEKAEIYMMLIDTSKEVLSKGLLIVNFKEAIESSVEPSSITEENQTKINNFIELTEAYLDSQEESS